ncbi:Z-ring associated protein ZapG [Klebsiella pneumoniae]|uniref:Z-ring associated protein ZapG n=1 Tax=Klebsiella pneumoniae TaxID=573 RepID=UPI00092CEC9F
MTWEYALIGLVVGIIIGAVAMRFGNRKLRQQQALQYELEKNKAELEEYREELVSHFARSAELLDNMAHDYRQLYQHMAKSSNNLLPDSMADANPFRNRLEESEASNDQLLASDSSRRLRNGLASAIESGSRLLELFAIC